MVYTSCLTNCRTTQDLGIEQHILTISSLSLPPKPKKLTVTETATILTHIWKTRNKLQFDDIIIPTTNVITNIKSTLTQNSMYHYTTLKKTPVPQTQRRLTHLSK